MILFSLSETRDEANTKTTTSSDKYHKWDCNFLMQTSASFLSKLRKDKSSLYRFSWFNGASTVPFKLQFGYLLICLYMFHLFIYLFYFVSLIYFLIIETFRVCDWLILIRVGMGGQGCSHFCQSPHGGSAPSHLKCWEEGGPIYGVEWGWEIEAWVPAREHEKFITLVVDLVFAHNTWPTHAPWGCWFYTVSVSQTLKEPLEVHAQTRGQHPDRQSRCPSNVNGW